MALTASCHCGATRFEVATAPESVTACNCTFCSKRGALWAYYEPSQFTLIADAHGVDYAPNGMNHHYFCGVCGCTTYSRTPVWTDSDTPPDPEHVQVSINTRLLDDFDLAAVPVEHVDGRNLW